MPFSRICRQFPLKPSASARGGRIAATVGSMVATVSWAFVLVGMLAQVGQAASPEHLWTSTVPLDGNRHMLMVVDPIRQVLAVYHVDAATGAVTLRSTRALAYDLQLEDFNAADPKPGALKKMLQLGSPPSSAPITIVPTPPQAEPAAP